MKKILKNMSDTRELCGRLTMPTAFLSVDLVHQPGGSCGRPGLSWGLHSLREAGQAQVWAAIPLEHAGTLVP
jgi:hypothetical protein